MAGRHADLQTAMVSGQVPEVARISQLMTKAAPASRADDRSFIGGEHSEVMRRFHSSCQFCELIRHQCGWVGVRVGEAAHPGPPGSVDEELLDCLQQDLLRGVRRRVRRRVMDSDSDVPRHDRRFR